MFSLQETTKMASLADQDKKTSLLRLGDRSALCKQSLLDLVSRLSLIKMVAYSHLEVQD